MKRASQPSLLPQWFLFIELFICFTWIQFRCRSKKYPYYCNIRSHIYYSCIAVSCSLYATIFIFCSLFLETKKNADTAELGLIKIAHMHQQACKNNSYKMLTYISIAYLILAIVPLRITSQAYPLNDFHIILPFRSNTHFIDYCSSHKLLTHQNRGIR